MATNTSLYVPPHRRHAASSLMWTPSLFSIPPIDEAFLESLDFFSRHLYTSSIILRYLTHVKNIYKEDPNIEARFVKRRTNICQASSKLFVNVYTKAMREIDYRTDCRLVSNDHVKRFLDLGCAPGGFSQWIIRNNRYCTGVGFTLPPELGGFPMEFDAPGRYTYFYQDITQNSELIGCQNNDDGGSGPQFDLCIAGCMFRNTETDACNYNSEFRWSRNRHFLRYFQLLAALKNLQEGGTLILVFNIRTHITVTEIICSLSCCFERLIPVKPDNAYAIRSSFYLVGVNYKREKTQKSTFLERLRAALDFIGTVDANWDFQKPLLLEGSQDQILAKWGSFVLEHYQVMWEVQARAIEKDLSAVLKLNNNPR
jgi:hypothetical protein